MHKIVISCDESYIVDVRNCEVGWDGHSYALKKSNPLKHIKDNLDHVFNWSVLANAPKNMFQRKVLEAYYIALEKPTLNEQLELDRSNLFRNGVT